MTRSGDEKPSCPACGALMTRIVYGFINAKLWEKAVRGEIIRGGCGMSKDSPAWGCVPCQRADAARWRADLDRRFGLE